MLSASFFFMPFPEDMLVEGVDVVYKTKDLFDLSHTLAADYLLDFAYPWEALAGLPEHIEALGKSLDPAFYEEVQPWVWVSKSALVAPSAHLGSPCIIGPETEVRHGAFVRGSVLVGEGCVVGNSVELKNVILFDKVQVPHFNYAGDSILGYKAHLGAGAITSNVKADKSPVVVRYGAEEYPTGLRKLGAMVGDWAEIGCNSVLNPGTVIGRRATVYPLSCVRITVPENHICKTGGVIVPRREGGF